MSSKELRQSHIKLLPFSARFVLAVALLPVSFAGCKSKQDIAIENAKKQAAATGQPQQITTIDSKGNTVTTTVQPPQPGQKDEAVTTTVAPKPAAEQAGQAPDTGTSQTAGTTPTPGTPTPAPTPPPNIQVAAGTALVIRINQRISAKDSHDGEQFTGDVEEPVVVDNGRTVIPKGSDVRGVVQIAHSRGDFKGAAELKLRLTSLKLGGKEYPLDTRSVLRIKKGKGKRSAGFIGGGAGLGLLIGGLAGGGKGAAIGGLAGAGAGTAGAGLTGNSDLVIPAESIVRFKLADDLVIEP